MNRRHVALAACLALLGAAIAFWIARSGRGDVEIGAARSDAPASRAGDAAIESEVESRTDALAAPVEAGAREQLAVARGEPEAARARRTLPVRLRAPAGAETDQSLAHEILFAPDFCPPFPVDVALTIEPLALGAAVDAEPETRFVASDANGLAIPNKVHTTDAEHTSLAHLDLDLSLVRTGSDGIGTLRVPARARYVNVLWRTIVVDVFPFDPAPGELVLAVDVERARARSPALQFVVVDKRTHEPVAGALAGFGSLRNSGRALTVDLGCEARRTDAAGFVRLRDLQPRAAARVYVQDAEHLTWSGDVVLEPGRITNLGTVELGRPIDVNVRVVDMHEKAVAHTLFFVARLPDPARSDAQVVTREDDSFEHVKLAPGAYVVGTAQAKLSKRPAPEWDAQLEHTAGAGARRDGAFGVPPCTVDVRDVEREEFVFELRWLTECAFEITPASSGTLVVRTADGTEAGRFAFLEAPRATRTNTGAGPRAGDTQPDALPPKRFQLLLAPGEYVAQLSIGGRVNERSFTFDGAETTVKLP